MGYNFTDFDDDLTSLDYTAHGPFIRLTGKFYDRTPEEIERLKKRREKKRIEQKLFFDIVFLCLQTRGKRL